MNGVHDVVFLFFLFILPPLLGILGISALARDRFSAGLLVCVFLSFAVLLAWQAIPNIWPALDSPSPTGAHWLWPVSVLALGVLLSRDRRKRYVRTTFESVLVLGSGAILLAGLLSMPDWLVEALPPTA